MVPTLVLVLALICRIESPASSLRRSNSLILRIGILFAAMTLIPKKGTRVANGRINNALRKILVEREH